MKDLIKQYLDQGLSRRKLVSGLSALGMSTVAAKAMAQNLTPAAQSAAPVAEAAHQFGPGSGGAIRAPSRFMSRSREAEAGKRRDHQVEGVCSISAVSVRISQWAEES